MRNKYEIRVFSMKHSGVHAVINWLATLFDEPVYFLNNCGNHQDPYRTGRTRGDRKGTPIEGIFVKLPKMKRWSEEDIRPIREMQKECIIYSYENLDLARFPKKPPTLDVDANVGSSEHVFDVLVHRDLLNWAAATFKDKGRKLREGFDPAPHPGLCWRNWRDREWLVGAWKNCAREFLGHTKHLRDRKVCVSYNLWLRREYREQLARKVFGRPNNEVSTSVVAGVGNRGSQFDGFDYDGRANRMRVLERWRHFEGDELFWGLLDEEALRLSAMIFH